MTGRASAMAALRASGAWRSSADGDRLELLTSGSTQTPRTITRSVDSWLDSFEPFSALTELCREDTVLVPATTASSMFAFAHAHAAWLGARTLTLPRWHPTVAAAAASTCTAGHFTPSMLADLLTRLPRDHRLRTVVCAGAPLPDRVRQDAMDAGLRVVDYYGAAELSVVAIRHPDGALRPFPGVQIELRDGIIWAKSPYTSDGYAPSQSGPFRRDAAGWCTVGDRGSWDDANGLRVQGRGDELILTGSASVLPEDVEQVLLTAPGIAAAVVVGLPHPTLGERVVAVVVARPGADLDGAQLRGHAAHQLTPSHRPRRWYTMAQLPLTQAGKVNRRAVRQALLEGTTNARALG